MTANNYVGSRKMNLAILSFALPMMLQAFVTGSINYVDSLTIGKLGDAAMGGRLIRLQAIGFIPYQMGMHGYYILKAGGDMRSIVMMDSVATWLIQIPIVVLVSRAAGTDIFLLYLSSQIGEVIKLGISLRLLHKGRWLVNLARTEG